MQNQEIKSIAQQIHQRQEYLTKEKLPIPEKKELIKEVIGETMEKEIKNIPPLKQTDGIAPSYPPEISSKVNPDIEDTLKKLTEIALEQGIKKAITLAFKTGNPFILDSLRDSLAGKYYLELKKLNLI